MKKHPKTINNTTSAVLILNDNYTYSECNMSLKIEAIIPPLQRSSNNRLIPSIDDNGGGVCVLSKEKLRQGEELASCYAAAIAMDPSYRDMCAYCASPCENSVNSAELESKRTGTGSRCKSCCMVSICERCKANGAQKWHVESGECRALLALAHAIHTISSQGEINEMSINIEMADSIDASYVLTVRLMIRRWNEKIASSPFPTMDWSLLDQLYKADVGLCGSTINEICKLMSDSFYAKSANTKKLMHESWINSNDFNDTMGKVLGCSHAITDVTAPLGCQSIGRSLFLEHSFYNHCCTPNSFLSSRIGDGKGDHKCALNARLHCIQDVEKGQGVTISYIPTSGLSCDERRQRLKQNYDFTCQCEACERKSQLSKKLDRLLCLPEDCDVEMIRQMQFVCNQQLLQLEHSRKDNVSTNHRDKDEVQLNEVQSCISTINMNKRGICNQGIPKHHEVSIESHRLLAKALSLSSDIKGSLKEQTSFRDAVEPIIKIFDPVAYSTSLVDYGRDLYKVGKDEEGESILLCARKYAVSALGEDHKMVQTINQTVKTVAMRERKRQKIESS